MRNGFTTGSCAAAAAKAAAYMLLLGKELNEITIRTPKGIPCHATIVDVKRGERDVSCAVKKDGGDDPDITTGLRIYANVCCVGAPVETRKKEEKPRVLIDGGTGVGRVTKPGLDQPVGAAAINHVPREMITREVQEVCHLADYEGDVQVLISVPGGKEVAQKTFNPRLGIQGGISIIGTTGIVEPMSQQALLDTIRVELRQRCALGQKAVAVTPGNYGLEFMKRTYGYDLDKSVKCSNFIGATVDLAAECGFSKMLLTGHIGKLIKVAGGIMNTHSKEGDCRLELLAAAAAQEGAEIETIRQILDAVVTEEGLRILKELGGLESVMEQLMEKICFYLRKRAAGRLEVECIMYSNEYGELAKSSGARQLLYEIKKEC